ncbi:MAG: hypothetical protein Q9159_002831 [Coniocarpon cinnabarinum]
MPTAHPDVKIMTFQSLQSEEFTRYFSESGAYFVMCHDGAAVSSPIVDTELEEQKSIKHSMRSTIAFFLGEGFNVWTLVLESSKRAPVPLAIDHAIQNSQPEVLQDHSSIGLPEYDAQKAKMIASESDLLTTLSLRNLHSSGKTNPNCERALLLHAALKSTYPLDARLTRDVKPFSSEQHEWLDVLCGIAARIVSCPEWETLVRETGCDCDVADFIDGLLLATVSDRMHEGPPTTTLGAAQRSAYVSLCSMVDLSPHKPQPNGDIMRRGKAETPASQARGKDMISEVKLLPFSNLVFDHHLTSIRIKVDEKAKERADRTSDQIFRELSHWHNTKPVQAKKSAAPVDPKARERALRREQFFMKDLTTYAASLTNATGKMLEPEIMIVKKRGAGVKDPKEKAKPENVKPGKASQAQKSNAKGAGKQKIMQEIEASRVQKEKQTGEKYVNAWRTQHRALQSEKDASLRYEKTQKFLNSLSTDSRKAVGTEIQLYMLDILLRIWLEICKRKSQNSSMHVAALVWHRIQSVISRPEYVSPHIMSLVSRTCQILGFPPPAADPCTEDRELLFDFVFSGPRLTQELDVVVTQDAREFQLEHCGPYMERSIDSAADKRTGGRFDPDRWQRDVLDAIDDEKSLFVVAPTSAGKTFISFYAMRKILEQDDDGVIIYVAPTKALVNQIAAEVQANFAKSYSYGAKSVWAMHTRDYRINSPMGCQVLVTVPHILQIMLLSPANAASWSPKVKRIIFDEIHSIGQAEDGIVWEQLLLIAPCPIIALSATVGNPDEFSDWLQSTQKSVGNELVVIQHPHRYSDLRKYTYLPRKDTPLEQLPDIDAFGELGLDKDEKAFAVMHPVSTLVNKSRGVPADFSLEPRECLALWKAMKKAETPEYQVDENLSPLTFFGDIIRKKDVHLWEAKLKDLLKRWMSDSSSPFDNVFEQLTHSVHPDTLSKAGNGQESDEAGWSGITDSALPLLFALHARDALPAILFNYDRGFCEKIGFHVLEQLQQAERSYKENNPSWKRKMERWNEWQKLKASKVKPAKATSKSDRNDKMSKDEQARETAQNDADPMESFNPDGVLDPFNFANSKVLLPSEFQDMEWRLRRRGITQWLCDALQRGIGIHHAGMNRAYRQAVEILFRKGFLRVVIATGTLALGINMPCKTVVFSGDSVYLTALNFRQAAGRAGRRGFDLLGNVVFHAVPPEKACRLVSSRLPSLNGHFPVTTSLVLRLFILLHESNNTAYAKRVVNALLSQPRLYLGAQSFKEQVLHHVRFSIEYLRRSGLLDNKGAPLNFAGCVSHLYFTENSSFALHALLKGGYFHRLTANMNKNNEEDIMRTMMLVLAHLFGRRPCREADLEPDNYAKRIKASPSVVLLPELPKEAHQILRQHNTDTLDVFRAYVKTFAEQHLAGKQDDTLPFTGLKFGGTAPPTDIAHDLFETAPTPVVRSQFVALSGHGDEFDTIQSLCRTSRSGVFLEESVIPHIPLYPDESSIPLNAYLLDFYKHGDTTALEKANGIRKGDMWFLLNDFSLVLATIVTALKNIMKIAEEADVDMIDLQGGGDASEEAEMVDQEFKTTQVTLPVVKETAEAKPAPQKKKKAVVESWDDDASDDADADGSGEEKSDREDGDGDGDEGEQGLDLPRVLRAFERLKVTFDEKFRAMWA